MCVLFTEKLIIFGTNTNIMQIVENMKLLRKIEELSQQEFADILGISRVNLSKYESGRHQPSLEVVIRMSRYYKISMDAFVTVPLTEENYEWAKKQLANETLLVPIKVDSDDNDLIEIIPESASAGYVGNYSDPEYVESLDYISMPIIRQHGKCRAFPISGDSMYPVPDGAYVISRQVTEMDSIKMNSRYIVVTRDQGILFKRLGNVSGESLILKSDNTLYDDIEMSKAEILELWEFVAALNIEPSNAKDDMQLQDRINRIMHECNKIQTHDYLR